MAEHPVNGAGLGACPRSIPIFERADLDPPKWPANRRPQRKRGRDHEVAVVVQLAGSGRSVLCSISA
jgi:hypothetical protein